MKRINKLWSGLILIAVLAFVATGVSCQSTNPDENEKLQFTTAIPCEGNCWVMNNSEENEKMIKEGGIQHWNSIETVFRCYFKVEKTGSLELGILAKSLSGSAKLKVTLGNISKEVSVSTAIESILIGGEATTGKVYFAHDDFY